jgi:hypothetical protein
MDRIELNDWLSKIIPIIEQLKAIDVDGEQLQYILEEIGMDEQMYKQLHATYGTNKGWMP